MAFSLPDLVTQVTGNLIYSLYRCTVHFVETFNPLAQELFF